MIENSIPAPDDRVTEHYYVATIAPPQDALSGPRIAPSLVAEAGHQASKALESTFRRAKAGGTELGDHFVRITVEIIRREDGLRVGGSTP